MNVWQERAALEGKPVSVEVQNASYGGILYAVDPESGGVILLSKGPRLRLVNGDSIRFVRESDAVGDKVPTTLTEASSQAKPVIDALTLANALNERRIRAVVVNEGSNLFVDVFHGVAKIVHPFSEHCCISENEIVLGRLKAVLSDILKREEHAGEHDIK